MSALGMKGRRHLYVYHDDSLFFLLILSVFETKPELNFNLTLLETHNKFTQKRLVVLPPPK